MTMCNTQTLMVLCMLGALVLLLGAEGVSVKRKVRRRTHGQGRGKDANIETVDLILDPSFMSTSIPLNPIGNNSLSPWTMSNTYDKNFYPPNIAEAKCQLKGCRNAGGEEVMDFESKPIYHQILVLRRVESSHKNYAYELRTRTISVGCTCVRPNVIHQK